MTRRHSSYFEHSSYFPRVQLTTMEFGHQNRPKHLQNIPKHLRDLLKHLRNLPMWRRKWGLKIAMVNQVPTRLSKKHVKFARLRSLGSRWWTPHHEYAFVCLYARNISIVFFYITSTHPFKWSKTQQHWPLFICNLC